MKKKYFIIILLLMFNINAIAQDFYETIANKLSKDILNITNDMRRITDNENIIIKVCMFTDKYYQTNNFSEQTTSQVVPIVNTNIQNILIRTSVKNYKNIFCEAEQPKNFVSKKYDFKLTWKYNMNDSLINFYDIKLTSTDNQYIQLAKFSIKRNINIISTDLQPKKTNYLKEVVETNLISQKFCNAVLISDKDNNNYYPDRSISSFFEYKHLDTLNEYHLNFDIKKNTYVYVLGYDPNDTNFIYLIYPFVGTENIIFHTGNNIVCDEYPLVFDFQGQQYKSFYLKFFFSQEYIDIDNYTEQKQINNDVFLKIMSQDNAKLFLSDFYNKGLNRVSQTNQILLNFD